MDPSVITTGISAKTRPISPFDPAIPTRRISATPSALVSMISNDGHSARYANAAMLSNRAKTANTKVRSGNQENTTESLNLL